jgi:hypothetical protein
MRKPPAFVRNLRRQPFRGLDPLPYVIVSLKQACEGLVLASPPPSSTRLEGVHDHFPSGRANLHPDYINDYERGKCNQKPNHVFRTAVGCKLAVRIRLSAMRHNREDPTWTDAFGGPLRSCLMAASCSLVTSGRMAVTVDPRSKPAARFQLIGERRRTC